MFYNIIECNPVYLSSLTKLIFFFHLSLIEIELSSRVQYKVKWSNTPPKPDICSTTNNQLHCEKWLHNLIEFIIIRISSSWWILYFFLLCCFNFFLLFLLLCIRFIGQLIDLTLQYELMLVPEHKNCQFMDHPVPYMNWYQNMHRAEPI